MRQVLYGKVASTSNYYFPLTGWSTGGDTYNGSNDTPMPTPGTLKNWIVVLYGAPGSGTSWIFTVYKNGFATSLQVTISDTATTGSDMTHSVDVAAGDTVYIVRTSSGSPTNVSGHWSLDWWDTVNNYSVLLGSSGSGLTGTSYAPVSYGIAQQLVNTLEYTTRLPMGAGTISRLYLCLKWSPGGPGSGATASYTVTLRVNGVSTSLTATVSLSGSQTGPVVTSDTAHSVTVGDGDVVTLQVAATFSGTVLNQGFLSWGMVYVTTAGDSYAMNIDYNGAASNSGTQYHAPFDAAGSLANWSTSASPHYQVTRKCTFSGMTAWITGQPGSGKSWTFSLMNITKGTSIDAVITGATYYGYWTGTFDCDDGDILVMRCVPAGTPPLAKMRWIMHGNNTPAALARSFGLVTG